MLRTAPLRLTVHRTPYKAATALPIACAQRWDLRLARAKLWDEQIDEEDKAAWQLEDERHMSPEFNTFVGFPIRQMKPGDVSRNRPKNIFNRRLPNWTMHEMHLRKDLPFMSNAMMGKALYDRTIHGFDVPYPYAQFKAMRKASRNDRVLKQNKFKIRIMEGAKSPPANFEPIPDAAEEEDDKK